MQSTFPIQLGATQDLREFARTRAGRIFLAISATAFVAICAHVSVPLYFTPVPVTLQTLAVILIGLALGPALGFSAMLLYLAEGAMGLPVFSPHGPGGVAQLLGPTAGFLFSYPLAAAAAGSLSEPSDSAVLSSRQRFSPESPPAPSSFPWAPDGSPICYASAQAPHGTWV
jgi:biotin transport system substrate-specific component